MTYLVVSLISSVLFLSLTMLSWVKTSGYEDTRGNLRIKGLWQVLWAFSIILTCVSSVVAAASWLVIR